MTGQSCRRAIVRGVASDQQTAGEARDRSRDDAGRGTDGETHDARSTRAVWIAVAVVAIPLLIATAFIAGRVTGSDAAPADLSADAGFARDMQVHHAQAVEMSLILRDRTTDAAARSLAYDIARTQQHQVGQMYAWLDLWGVPQASSRAPMAWADDMAGHQMEGESRMPGLAPAADLRRLGSLTGPEAERLYLQLMIAHHRGGVEMAQAALDRARRPEVLSLARKIVEGQTSEIKAMEGMLRERR